MTVADALMTVPIEKIREPKEALRGVKIDTEEFRALVDSIKEDGVINPISVRPVPDEDGMYEVIDGLQRFSASKEAGLEEMNVHVMEADELKTFRLQIIGNIHKIETKPVEYSRQLQRIIAIDPLLTQTQLADQLKKSTAWITQRLGLLKLHDELAKSVDNGDINLSNAYSLAKLPPEEQLNWAEDAMTEPPDVFNVKVLDRKKELDKARREGREPGEAQFQAKARFQKMAEVEAEIEDGVVGPALLKQMGITDPYEAFKTGLLWCIRLDPNSKAEAQQKWEDKRKADKERRELATRERTGKRAEIAQWKADRLKVEAQAVKDGKSGEEVDALLKTWDEEHPEPKTKTESN